MLFPRIFQHPPVWKLALGAVLAGILLALNACGGGAGAVNSTPSGNLSIQLTDGSSSDFNNAYVTLFNIMVHKNANVVDTGDLGWISINLPATTTIDLNHLNNGALANLLSSVTLPANTYRTIRLNFLPWNYRTLYPSAPAIRVNGTLLNYYNTIVEANGQQYPLEIPMGQGLTLNGNFTVAANQTLNLAVEVDAGDDILRFQHGAGYAYLMNPTLRAFDLSQSGAISGSIDTTACAPNCTDFVVKAERLSDDGSHYEVARWTTVTMNGNSGTFTLYPVPVGASPQTYDVVVRGRNAQTMIVRSVPVSASATSANATVISSTPLLAAAATEFTVTTTASTPSATWLQFYQTVNGAGNKPYEMRFRQTNPFTGTLQAPEPLVTGPWQVGDYVANGTPTLVSQNPAEGAGTYQVWFNGANLTRTQATTVSAGARSIAAPPSLLQSSDVAALGSISGQIAVTNPGTWTSAQLVVTRAGTVVNAIDVSSQVANGGSFAVSNLPAGSTAQPFAAGVYLAYLRVWNAQSLAPDMVRIIQIPGIADLRTSATASLSVTLP